MKFTIFVNFKKKLEIASKYTKKYLNFFYHKILCIVQNYVYSDNFSN